jgi:hypothetical protein
MASAEMQRLRQLYRNAGLWGVVRTALVLVVVLAFGALTPYVQPAYWPMSVGAAVGLVLPGLARAALVRHLELVQRLHRYAGFGILIALVVLHRPIKQAGPVTAAVCLGLLAAYISVYFWLLSDPQVFVERRKGR